MLHEQCREKRYELTPLVNKKMTKIKKHQDKISYDYVKKLPKNRFEKKTYRKPKQTNRKTGKRKTNSYT